MFRDKVTVLGCKVRMPSCIGFQLDVLLLSCQQQRQRFNSKTSDDIKHHIYTYTKPKLFHLIELIRIHSENIPITVNYLVLENIIHPQSYSTFANKLLKSK